jgi:transcriptional regulator with XRE-family HTH domain
MAKKFRDLVAPKPASWHAAIGERQQELLAANPLQGLRRTRQLSQEQLAEELGATQPEISGIASASATEGEAKKEFPPGWTENRVRELIAHYESQTEDEAAAEDAAAFEHRGTSMVEVPVDLFPEVRKLLGKD